VGLNQPRVTCYKVGIRLDEPRMAALLTRRGRPGFYLRVFEEGAMLQDSDIYATIPVTDLDRARAWYAARLGLRPEREFPGGALRYLVGEHSAFLLFLTEAAGTSEHQVAAWVVDDLDAEVAALRGRGVTFEEYDRPELKTVAGIARTPAGKGAWFKDSEGNVLTMIQLA
jgi:catechol 2,3-dioxygenase-like lactoylglutathione lyase family enzyme